MTVPTPPAVSDAMREAVARILDPEASTYGEADYYGPETSKANASARLRVALKNADAILSGPIASEIARLTGENADLLAQHVIENDRMHAAEAETARLRAALKDAIPSLAAAISLLEQGGKQDVGSDRMFAQMIADYRKSLTEARAALTSQEKTDG